VLQGLAILAVLVLALLAVPWTVAFRFRGVQDASGQLSVRWLFGLVRFRVGIPGPAGSRPRRRKKPATKTRKRRRGGNARGALALLRQAAFRRRVVRLAGDLLRALRVRGLHLRLRIGLGDPADTGRLWSLLGPLAGMAASLRGADVRIEPEFADPVLEVESHGAIRLVPLQLVALAAAFLLSPATLRAWPALRQGGA